ncbi:pectinesterase-like [Dioscorea cayenensis subsp. rotundata]|uniref:Pectinesterase n=1 Tax=Dioscorea cayennensis subsp. rotundata TaxID=55577 RepID=A0AB40CX29_DIOCR|nr:pectinesterase-like [Dioscorea cayenensis subsp. rotundata]
MAKFMAHLLAFSLFMAFRVCTSDPILSCTQTPYPYVCTSSISNTIKDSLGFLNSALQATLDHAVQTHKLASSIDVSLFDERAKAAWNDCLELCEDTISHLNKCMSPNSVSFDDSQTWLSAAIANQQTCMNGFKELNVNLSHLPSFPFTSNNISKFISNSLAINKAFSPVKSGGNRRLLSDNFPNWLSISDRKLLQSSTVKADLTVAQDGSGDYKTISEAVSASSKIRSGSSRVVISVKAGVYNENVQIGNSMKNIMMVGDGIDQTIVTGSKNVQDGSTTFQSATFAVTGSGFIAKGMTFENTAGPQKHQAVALRSGADLSVFYQCSFKGYQDTLYVYSQRQFYRNCDIYGTVDFIFGDAAAVFQNCNMYVRKPMSQQQNTVTAQGRTDPNENTGIIVHNSVVSATSELQSVQGSIKTYLGRPWQKYSRTVFMKTSLGSLIDPAGWLAWDGDFALSTLYYGEYMNTGSGASTSGRVKWAGYHVITSASEAGKFTVGNFLAGNSWIPATGVPFTSGL